MSTIIPPRSISAPPQVSTPPSTSSAARECPAPPMRPTRKRAAGPIEQLEDSFAQLNTGSTDRVMTDQLTPSTSTETLPDLFRNAAFPIRVPSALKRGRITNEAALSSFTPPVAKGDSDIESPSRPSSPMPPGEEDNYFGSLFNEPD